MTGASDPANETADAAEAIDVTESVGAAIEHTAECQTAATETETTIEEIALAASEMRGTVRELEEVADRIDETVEAIADVADQTSVLALNANIEAARAGEGSEGFAVVADEVQALAEESRTRAEEIEGFLETIETGTDEAAEGLETVNRKVSEGLGSSQRTTTRLESIETELRTLQDQLREGEQDI